MMGHKDKLKSGGEWDLVTGWRHCMCYTRRPGVCKKIKNQINRRSRRAARKQISEHME